MTNASHFLAEMLRPEADSEDVLVCAWCTLGSSFAAETVALSGADLVCVDAEHGLLGWDQALAIVVTLSAGGHPVVVRVSANEPSLIMKALDAGADGVIVPHISSAQEAANAAAACRYPPKGRRSWGPTRASLLGRVADSPACIVMVETAAAVHLVDEIAAAPGIDGVLVGGNDLALDLLRPGGSAEAVKESPEFERLLASVAASCAAAGIVAGAPALPSLGARRLHELGFRLIVAPSDAALLRSAATREFAAVRSSPTAEADGPLASTAAY